MRERKNITTILLLIFLLIITSITAGCEENEKIVILAEIKGEISKASVNYLRAVLSEAERRNAELIILTLDTPGGSVDAVKEIIELIDNSEIPIAVYVYPSGATAWSGGAIILMSSHIAAMTPGTSVGSAQPVEITPAGIVYVEESKIVNALAEMIAAQAELHCRNVTVSRLLVTENLNLAASDALEYGLIDVVASSINELLDKIEEGCILKRADKVCYSLERDREMLYSFKGISEASVLKVEPSIGVYLLSIIENPVVSSVFLILGLFLILIGIKTPGLGMEIAGVLSLGLSFLGYGFIGVHIFGVLLLVLGFLFALAEIKANMGFLALIGSAMMIIGLVALIPSERLWISYYVLESIVLYSAIIGILSASVFLLIVYKVRQVYFKKPAMGPETLIGSVGVAYTDIDPEGEVRVRGEFWRARCLREKVKKGSRVRVLNRKGLVLIVEEVKAEVSD